MILSCEPLEEVDCFKYLRSQVAADGGCDRDVVHRMNLSKIESILRFVKKTLQIV